MSKEDVMSILDSIQEQNINPLTEYKKHFLAKFKMSREKDLWNKDIILQFIKKALSKGFHGIHFISNEYVCIMDDILAEYFGENHCITFRNCERHGKIILLPDYEKLGVNPTTFLKPSYIESKNMYPYKQEKIANFCFE